MKTGTRGRRSTAARRSGPSGTRNGAPKSGRQAPHPGRQPIHLHRHRAAPAQVSEQTERLQRIVAHVGEAHPRAPARLLLQGLRPRVALAAHHDQHLAAEEPLQREPGDLPAAGVRGAEDHPAALVARPASAGSSRQRTWSGSPRSLPAMNASVSDEA